MVGMMVRQKHSGNVGERNAELMQPLHGAAKRTVEQRRHRESRAADTRLQVA